MQTEKTYSEALLEATRLEMERDSSVIVLGEGVNDPIGIYGTTRGLADMFGTDRVIETPLAEEGMTGVAIGSAMGGMRPIHVHIRMDFLLLAMNALVNTAAKARYMWGGRVSVPLVVRSIIGRSWGQGPQHSQGLYPQFMNIPGLLVVAPSTAYDAKGSLAASIRSNDPVMFVEHRMLHPLKGYVPGESFVTPIGQARVLAEGSDVTLVGVSYMAVECLRAREHLRSVGISAEVIDPIWLSPLDMKTISASASKTGAVIVVDNAWPNCGASAEILARLTEDPSTSKKVKMGRAGFAPVPCPTTRVLEDRFYPDSGSIASHARTLLLGKPDAWMPEQSRPPEVAAFKGPF